MSERLPQPLPGIERLKTPERAQYESLKKELIQAATNYDRTGDIHSNGNMHLIMPMERLLRLKKLVEFMGIGFDECEDDLKQALKILDLKELFFPEKNQEVAEDPVSRRPAVEDTWRTSVSMVDRERESLNALIQTVDNIRRNSLEVKNLPRLCEEIVQGCKKYGGVKNYLGESELSDFILEHAPSVGLSIGNIEVKKPTPQHPVIPPPSREPPVAEDEVPDYGATSLQRFVRKIAKIFGGK